MLFEVIAVEAAEEALDQILYDFVGQLQVGLTEKKKRLICMVIRGCVDYFMLHYHGT